MYNNLKIGRLNEDQRRYPEGIMLLREGCKIFCDTYIVNKWGFKNSNLCVAIFHTWFETNLNSSFCDVISGTSILHHLTIEEDTSFFAPVYIFCMAGSCAFDWIGQIDKLITHRRSEPSPHSTAHNCKDVDLRHGLNTSFKIKTSGLLKIVIFLEL